MSCLCVGSKVRFSRGASIGFVAGLLAALTACTPPRVDDVAVDAGQTVVAFRSPDLSDSPTRRVARAQDVVLETIGIFMLAPTSDGRNPIRRWVARRTHRTESGEIFYSSPEIGAEGGELRFERRIRKELLWGGGGLMIGAAALAALARRKPLFAFLSIGVASTALTFLQAGLVGFFSIFAGDEALYVQWARELSTLGPVTRQGSGLGWPLMLAPFMRPFAISSDPIMAAYQLGPFVAALLGGALPALVGLLIARLFGEARAGIFGAIVTVAWTQLARHPYVGWPPGPHVGRTVLEPLAHADGPFILDIYFFSQRTGLTLLSDLPALVVILASALVAAVSTRARGWAFAGMLLGFAGAIRQAAAFSIAPILLMALWSGSLRARLSRVGAMVLGAAVGYSPQAIAMWAWTGSPFSSVTSINSMYLRERILPEWSLARALDLGLAFHGGFHASLVAATAAGLFALSVRGDLRRVTLVVVGVLGVYLPIASFAFCCNQPDRYVWPAIPWVAAAVGSIERRPAALGSVALLVVLGLCPGWPLDARLGLELPRILYSAAPFAALALALVGAILGKIERTSAIAIIAAAGVATFGAGNTSVLWGAFLAAPLFGWIVNRGGWLSPRGAGEPELGPE
ncbi:MAG: hypothetical protein HYV07_25000 [Deltaproteobacteria bacterium]|nr:hypothetical protein [Deltaproteobacteria bacterium]